MSPSRKTYGGGLLNYLVQAEGTKTWLLGEWNRLLAEGYVEVSPGILRRPTTGIEVLLG